MPTQSIVTAIPKFFSHARTRGAGSEDLKYRRPNPQLRPTKGRQVQTAHMYVAAQILWMDLTIDERGQHIEVFCLEQGHRTLTGATVVPQQPIIGDLNAI